MENNMAFDKEEREVLYAMAKFYFVNERFDDSEPKHLSLVHEIIGYLEFYDSRG